MAQIYVVPNWFFGLSIGFEVFFALTTLLVAYYAIKLYRVSGERSLRRFGIGFILISLSYSLWAVMNALISKEMFEGMRELEFSLNNIWLFSNIAVYLHAIFYVSGLVLIAYTTLKIESRKTLALLELICLASILACMKNDYFIVYLLSAVLALFIYFNYLEDYRRNKNKTTAAIMAAFVLLFAANIDFMLAANNYIHYIIRHILELGAYFIILASLIKIIKHGEKKKQAGNHP